METMRVMYLPIKLVSSPYKKLNNGILKNTKILNFNAVKYFFYEYKT